MPRQIEYFENGVWSLWCPETGNAEGHDRWRYVGGVLENCVNGTWYPWKDQSLTLDDAQRRGPSIQSRLRPYDDAAGLAIGPAGIAALKELTFGPSPALQAEQQKQHAGRQSSYELSGLGDYHRRQQAQAVPATQRPADASVAPRTGVRVSGPREDVSAVDCADYGRHVLAANAEYRNRLLEVAARANELSDTCGTLRTELDEAYAKIGRLTREVERLGRKKR